MAELNLHERAQRAVREYGWGPNWGDVVFRREGRGWRLGNGLVCTLWESEVPDSAEQAMSDIETANNAIRLSCGLPALTSLVSRHFR